MKRTTWLIGLAASLGACGFGDNGGRAVGVADDCGDGIVDPGEGCDDGNHAETDGCSSDCAVEAANAVCGNGIRETGEACDDGDTVSGDGCSASCEIQSLCGNGTQDAGEECDDGNHTSGDGCSPACEIEAATACGLLPQSGCAAGEACDLTSALDTATEDGRRKNRRIEFRILRADEVP